MLKSLAVLPLIAAFIFNGCPGHTHDDETAGPGGWLTGDTQQKFDTIARQLGGFSVAMQEVGYRYTELYWAGMDQNWDYASYQAAKIGSAIEAGIERRPGRAESAARFLQTDLPLMQHSIAQKDRNIFLRHFDTFTQSCNTCHNAEEVAFITVQKPEYRISPIKQ